MKNTRFTIFILLIYNFTHAQNNYLLLSNCPDSVGSYISFNSNYSLQTNSLSCNLINAIKRSEYLSDDLKKSSSIKNYNYVNYNLKEELSYSYMPVTLFEMQNTGLHVGISYEQWFIGSFNKDLYNLIAFGNKEFIGKEADLSKSLFQYFNYGTFSFGAFKIFNSNSVITKALVGINFHAFKDFQYIYLSSASIYTTDDGSYINLKAKGAYKAKSNNKSFNVAGISFNTAINFTNKESFTNFTFQLEQLGAAFLNQKSYYATIDTSITYSGVEINQIFNNPQYHIGILSNDSISYLYEKYLDTTAFTSLLPLKIKLAFSKKFRNKILDELECGLSYYFRTKQKIPELYISQSFKTSKFLSASLGISYGGFIDFSMYLGLKVHLNKIEFDFSLGNLINYINKSSPSNTNILCGIKKYW